MDKPVQKHLDQAMINLDGNKDFQLIEQWFAYERTQIIKLLTEAQPPEILMRLSGQLQTLTFIIEEIKEKQKQ